MARHIYYRATLVYSDINDAENIYEQVVRRKHLNDHMVAKVTCDELSSHCEACIYFAAGVELTEVNEFILSCVASTPNLRAPEGSCVETWDPFYNS